MCGSVCVCVCVYSRFVPNPTSLLLVRDARGRLQSVPSIDLLRPVPVDSRLDLDSCPFFFLIRILSNFSNTFCPSLDF